MEHPTFSAWRSSDVLLDEKENFMDTPSKRGTGDIGHNPASVRTQDVSDSCRQSSARVCLPPPHITGADPTSTADPEEEGAQHDSRAGLGCQARQEEGTAIPRSPRQLRPGRRARDQTPVRKGIAALPPAPPGLRASPA